MDAQLIKRKVPWQETERGYRHKAHFEEFFHSACRREVRGNDTCNTGTADPNWSHDCVKAFPWTEEDRDGMKAQTLKLKIRNSLYEECKAQIKNYRPNRPKGAIAEGFVGLLLNSCRGELDRQPEFDGKRPDYEWTVAPEIPSSFRFIVEVVYGGNDTPTAVERVERKVHKYPPPKEHQYYVVALVYEEGTDIQEVASHCMGKLEIEWAMDMNTGEMTSETTKVIPQKYTEGNASLLWAIPFPTDSTGETFNLEMQIIEILSENAKHLHNDIFKLNLLSSPGMSSEEYQHYKETTAK